MPFFVPLITASQLPAIGADIERAVMDWKASATQTTAFHKAKDVAAFANHLGGTILVGAAESGGQLASYVGMTPAEAAALRDAFSRAVRDKCEPPPAVDFGEIEVPGDPTTRVVAVNVPPSLNLVGVKVKSDRTAEGYGGDAYVYPVRSGTDALYLRPSQLPMYMTPQVRRAAVMMSRIPQGTQVKVHEARRSLNWTWKIVSVEEEQNLVRMEDWNPPHAAQHVPLDQIITVYQQVGGDWRMVVDQR